MDLIGHRTLRDHLEEMVTINGEKEFLIIEYDSGKVDRLTYREFDDLVNRTANSFLASGVVKGDRFAILLPTGIAYLASWFACAKIGAIAVPLNVACSTDEIAYFLTYVEAGSLIIAEDLQYHLEGLGDAAAKLRTIWVPEGPATSSACSTQPIRIWRDEVMKHSVDLASADISSDTVAQILFTSGSTARPKGVMHTHANCLWSGERTAKSFRLCPEDISLTVLPLFHVNAMSFSVLGPLIVGATACFIERYSASQYWQQVRKYGATYISLLPFLIRTQLALPPSKEDGVHGVKTAVYGLNCTDRERAEYEARFNVKFINLYGLTEAITLVLAAPLDRDRRWPSVGMPVFDRDVRLFRSDGQEAAIEEVGEIAVHGVPGRTIMLGYYHDEAATASTIRDGWLFTGDQAWRDAHGHFYYVDRSKDMIKRNGENISAGEVERALIEHPKVADCAVIAIPDPLRDEAVKAYIVAKADVELRAEEVTEYCKRYLASFKVPTVIEFRSALPKTSIGKTDKGALRREKPVDA